MKLLFSALNPASTNLTPAHLAFANIPGASHSAALKKFALPTLTSHITHLLFFSIFGMLASQAAANTQVKIPSQNTPLDGYFYPAQTTSASPRKAPAIVALHGCGGMLDKNRRPNTRSHNYAKLLNAQGWHVLFIDSLTSRGVKSICDSHQAKQVTPTQRATDIQAALTFLAQNHTVDPQRIGILGWSNGGGAALLASQQGITYHPTPKATFVFYPDCAPASQHSTWQPAWPILMQLGAADDWTPSQTCQQLAARWPALIQQNTYPNAHHGFDSEGAKITAMHIQQENNKKTVHTGGHPAAKTAAQNKLLAFFKERFQ